MDKLERYRQIVREILDDHSQIKPAFGEVQMKLIFDETRDRYQLFRTGWVQEDRVYGALIHIDLEGSKFWIQYDGTEVGVESRVIRKRSTERRYCFSLSLSLIASI